MGRILPPYAKYPSGPPGRTATGRETSVVASTFAVRAAVAFNAVVEVTYAFFAVLSQHVLNGVFMASIAGVLAVVVVDVASFTGSVVVAVQHKKLVMVQGRRLPCVL
jgi:hypothetical protein